jgi:hypothetical protein
MCLRWAESQPRLVGQSAAPDSSIALGKEEKVCKVSIALTLLHTHSHTAYRVTHLHLQMFFLVFLDFASQPTIEVVQRAHPFFNPKGICPRWAES